MELNRMPCTYEIEGSQEVSMSYEDVSNWPE